MSGIKIPEMRKVILNENNLEMVLTALKEKQARCHEEKDFSGLHRVQLIIYEINKQVEIAKTEQMRDDYLLKKQLEGGIY